MKESRNFEVARLKKKKKKKKKKEEKHFGHLATFWFGTFAMLSILSGESKELITRTKAWGYSGEKASGMISIRFV